MKKTLYTQYYKLGFEHFINKQLMHLHKPNAVTNVFYMTLIIAVIIVANLG